MKVTKAIQLKMGEVKNKKEGNCWLTKWSSA